MSKQNTTTASTLFDLCCDLQSAFLKKWIFINDPFSFSMWCCLFTEVGGATSYSLLMNIESVTSQMNSIKQHFAVGFYAMHLRSMHSKLKRSVHLRQSWEMTVFQHFTECNLELFGLKFVYSDVIWSGRV